MKTKLTETLYYKEREVQQRTVLMPILHIGTKLVSLIAFILIA